MNFDEELTRDIRAGARRRGFSDKLCDSISVFVAPNGDLILKSLDTDESKRLFQVFEATLNFNDARSGPTVQ